MRVRERERVRKRERERERERERKRIRERYPCGGKYICIEGEGAAQGIGKLRIILFLYFTLSPIGEIWFYSRVSIRAHIVQIFELFWSYGWT